MTVANTISIGKISSYLASVDIANGALYGERLDTFKPVLLAMETDILDWQNDFDPSDASLQQSANYLYSLCAPYNVEAQGIIDGNNGGTVPIVIPDLPAGGVYLIPIRGSNFTDATHYDDARIALKSIAIFWNDANRYLSASEFSYTATGFDITISGFDATANPQFQFFIYIIN